MGGVYFAQAIVQFEIKKEAEMPKYNTTFELSLQDMDLIEEALTKVAANENDVCPSSVQDLLGRLHNQKVFYRPKGVYVSG